MYESPRASSRISSAWLSTSSVRRDARISRGSLSTLWARWRSFIISGAGFGTARNNEPCMAGWRPAPLLSLFVAPLEGKRLAGNCPRGVSERGRNRGGGGFFRFALDEFQRAADEYHSEGQSQVDVHPHDGIGLEPLGGGTPSGEETGKQEKRKGQHELDAHHHVVI